MLRWSVILWAVCLVPPVAIADEGPLVLYLANSGVDERDGLSPETAIRSLRRAQDVLREQLESSPRRAEVRIAPGTYRGQSVVWSFTMPEHEIKFLPSEGKRRPVFDGAGRAATWFRLDHARGEQTNLNFHYIEVRNYGCAISLNGNRDQEETCNRANRIYGCRFVNVGENSTAAVRLVNSKANVIENNHFIDIVRSKSPGLLHAIYAAHLSSDNRIYGNRFENVCGDPIRIRDYSNNNQITSNVFIRAGIYAACSDWFCDHDARDDCSKSTAECPSWNNRFQDNQLESNFKGDPLPATKVFQDDETTGCGKPGPDAVRMIQG